MVKEYHKTVETLLLKLGEEWKSGRRIKHVYRGCQRPLSIVDPREKLVLNYQPDVYFILRNNKKLIFEVLESEAEKQDIIVADVIRSFLVENVEALIFIHPGPESVETAIIEALVTIYKGLVHKGVSPPELPIFKKMGPYLLTREEARDADKAKNKLIQYATEAKWLFGAKPPKANQ
jgi:hypothetical protein